MTEKYFILFDTETGTYIQCNEFGEINTTYIINEMISGWDIFTDVEDKETMNKVLQVFDPKGIKRNKHLVEMLPDYIKDNKVKKLSVNVNNQLVTVYGVLVKPGIRKYITLKLEPFDVIQFDSMKEVNKFLKDGGQSEVSLSDFEFALLNELTYKLGKIDAEMLVTVINTIKSNEEIINQ